jgi:hypothetical protein
VPPYFSPCQVTLASSVSFYPSFLLASPPPSLTPPPLPHAEVAAFAVRSAQSRRPCCHRTHLHCQLTSMSPVHRIPCSATYLQHPGHGGEDLVTWEAAGEPDRPRHRAAVVRDHRPWVPPRGAAVMGWPTSFPRWAKALGRILGLVPCSHFFIFVFLLKFPENRVNF